MPLPKSPEFSAALLPRGRVVETNPLTLNQVLALKDHDIRRRQSDLEDHLGGRVTEVATGLSDQLRERVKKGIAINLVTPPRHPRESFEWIYATPDDLSQIAIAKRGGLLSEEESFRLIARYIQFLEVAEKNMRGGVLTILPDNDYRERVGSFTMSMTLDRFAGAIENDCDGVDLSSKSFLELQVGAPSTSRFREVERRARANDFADARFVFTVTSGIPEHTSFMREFAGELVSARDSIVPKYQEGVIIPNTSGQIVTPDQLPYSLVQPTEAIQWKKVQETLTQIQVEQGLDFNLDTLRKVLSPKIPKLSTRDKIIAAIVGAGAGVAVVVGGVTLKNHRKDK